MDCVLTYYIIYPSGNKTLLAVLDLGDYEGYELDDWSLASRQSFQDLDKAMSYGEKLALQHGKEFTGFLNRHGNSTSHCYLD